MTELPAGLGLPSTLSDIDADFMTTLLRDRGVISASNAVESIDESDVGMTAGYFSAIKRVKCHYAQPTDAQNSFVAKAWPDFEMAPKEQISGMFLKDINGYLLDSDTFFPSPRIYLAGYDTASNRWALVMEDANTFAEQKLHEHELGYEEVLRMIPRLVEMAAAWEGCDRGEKAATLDRLDIGHWASDENLAAFKFIMPGGAKLFDRVMEMGGSTLIDGPTWDTALGKGFAELFTRKLDAFYEPTRSEQGATCTLAHGDLRGDNIFFCEPCDDYPDGWLTIDFQLMFRGPVPSDLAYLMNSGSVLPEVYAGENRDRVLRTFYDQFMAKTRLYADYTFEQFQLEYAIMSTVQFVYYVGFGAAIWQAGLNNEQPARVELGDAGATLDDLAPDELRKRMWWRKAIANFGTTFKDFGLYQRLETLPANAGGMGDWVEVPARLA